MPKRPPSPGVPGQISFSPDHGAGSLVAGLALRYGYDGLQGYVKEYTGRLDKLSALNKSLAGIDAASDKKAYNKIMDKILEFTKEYYSYIGDLPTDIRAFFLNVADDADINLTDGFTPELTALMDGPAATLLHMQSIRPKNYTMQLDPATGRLTALKNTEALKVGNINNSPIITTVTLDTPEHMKVEGGSLSTYDKSVINGVTSLIESGNIAFSIPMLYHAMTGRPNPSLEDSLYNELKTRLEKMRVMTLTIDITEEIKARFITTDADNPDTVEDVQLSGYLLPLIRVSGVINGKKTEVYQLIQHPPLYQYSKLKKQLATVPISLLSAPVNNNATTIPLKSYLLRRVELMKNKHNTIQSTVILYQSIYKELDAENADKTKKARIRGYAAAILDHFIEEGYIKSYSPQKKGRELYGVEVEVCP
jgi:hypothetical protein